MLPGRKRRTLLIRRELMTGRQLLKWLQSLTPEQLDDYSLSIEFEDEFYPIQSCYVLTEDNGILDVGSPIIEI